ncbi:MAG: hypothetical protein ACKV2U_07570 [Bryobacteraceae bacterium]
MKRLIACAVLTFSLLGNAAAQERNIQHRRTYAVKRGHLADFVSTMKELQALYKTAKIDAPMIVLQSLTGPDRIMTIRYYAKMSDAVANRGDAFKNNHEAEYAALNMRLNAFVDDRETRVAERDTELSLPRAENPSPYFRVIRTEVKPGKMDEYRAVAKEFVSGGVKPAGVKSYTWLQTRMGGPAGEIMSGTGIQSLTELDENAAIKAMGDAKYKVWAAKRAVLINGSETNLYRYRADLSTWPWAK